MANSVRKTRFLSVCEKTQQQRKRFAIFKLSSIASGGFVARYLLRCRGRLKYMLWYGLINNLLAYIQMLLKIAPGWSDHFLWNCIFT